MNGSCVSCGMGFYDFLFDAAIAAILAFMSAKILKKRLSSPLGSKVEGRAAPLPMSRPKFCGLNLSSYNPFDPKGEKGTGVN
jgi:hypothetical protein